MATDSFKFWDSYYSALRMLGTDERRGRFVMALCAYVFDGVDPCFDDDAMAFGFELVATQARESKELSARKRDGGIKSGASRRAKAQAKSVRKSVPNEKKGKEEKGTESSFPSPDQTVAPPLP